MATTCSASPKESRLWKVIFPHKQPHILNLTSTSISSCIFQSVTVVFPPAISSYKLSACSSATWAATSSETLNIAIWTEPYRAPKASIIFKWLPYISPIALVAAHISITEPTGGLIWSSIINSQLYCTWIKKASFYGWNAAAQDIQFTSCSPLKALAAFKILFMDLVSTVCLFFLLSETMTLTGVTHPTSHQFDVDYLTS